MAGLQRMIYRTLLESRKKADEAAKAVTPKSSEAREYDT